MLKLIIVGILVCLASLCLLYVMEDSSDVHYVNSVVDSTAQTFVIEEEREDFFDKWQKEQPDKLNQRKWDCYMGDDDEV